MKRRGLLDAEPTGQVTAPRRTSVRGTPHHLAYITAEEAALLRARGGGLTRDGRPLRGPAGVPAFDNSGDGGDGADGGAGGSADGHGDSGAADGHGDSGAADGHGNSSGPDGTSDGNGDNGGYGLANYLGSLLPQGPDPRAAQREAWRSALTAPIDQTPRSFVAGGAMQGAAPQAPVASYNYGAFPTAPPVIGAMQPLPAAPAPGAPPASGGLPPVPNLGLPSYAPPGYGMQPTTLARLQQVGVMPRYGAAGLAGNPNFNALLGRMR
ncbi:hypothetical protein GXW71_32650 [Roseomonas hellenica]|uniref:Uncharacterized protein n=1 Tax=Plastoroseomonas hellenica TaxID=2687306 RepID=A0ABS5F9I0_9PROT|nr:hypothetical protein [Plastoroseomonas hellenica]MBR0669146.1 hypothetical protein [Plastoroseomonas hellenica]